MTGGSAQLRAYRIARSNGLSAEDAAAFAGIDPIEARLIDEDDANNPPGPECFVPLTPPQQEIEMAQPEEVIDPVTGEVTTTAADGRMILPVASTFAHLIMTLEMGALNDEATERLHELSITMQEFAERFGDRVKVKGKFKLELEFTQQGDITYIQAKKVEAVLPQEGRRNTIMWALPDGRYSANPPSQGQLFGVRDVTPSASVEIRDVTPTADTIRTA